MWTDSPRLHAGECPGQRHISHRPPQPAFLQPTLGRVKLRKDAGLHVFHRTRLAKPTRLRRSKFSLMFIRLVVMPPLVLELMMKTLMMMMMMIIIIIMIMVTVMLMSVMMMMMMMIMIVKPAQEITWLLALEHASCWLVSTGEGRGEACLKEIRECSALRAGFPFRFETGSQHSDRVSTFRGYPHSRRVSFT